MTEIALALDVIPQNLQALGWLLPVLGCCMTRLARLGGVKYFSGEGSNYFDKTGRNLLKFLEQEFMAHDHEVDGKKPKRGEYVVSVQKGDAVDQVIVDEKNLTKTAFLSEGSIIPGTLFKHKHNGQTGAIGPWEH